MKKEKNYFTIRKLSIYTVNRIWAESPKFYSWKSKEKAQLIVLCCNLKLMSRHKLVLIAHDQSRPLLLSVPTVLMRDLSFMSRHHCLPILPRLCCDISFRLRPLFLCKTTSCCDFDFLVAILLVVFFSS